MSFLGHKFLQSVSLILLKVVSTFLRQVQSEPACWLDKVELGQPFLQVVSLAQVKIGKTLL
ncbi:hypothetical protein GCM10007972_27150 [Iodidimonas muriae]|uniref:Uncharacterized protein n=1 Tax=Iodidimonas muriae TaxID=261467 RepID=A0ABQ2LGE4_9PROT|nr:hypothetical protein JCM17843_30070 [Kordiimonadales bacterium JCM 17843]GGO17211.1 hypothetical protein GCM10007972_27150 [Iodidimonas muriae]